MRRVFGFVTILAMAAGGTCQTNTGAGMPVPCPTDLTEAAFRFALKIPCAFQSAAVATTLPDAKLHRGFLQNTPRLRLNVFVVPISRNTGPQPGVNVEDLPDVTNPQGVQFTQLKVTVPPLPGYTLGASTPLPDGDQLLIQVSGIDNEADAARALAEAVGSVSITP